jgi:hypothetical protein
MWLEYVNISSFIDSLLSLPVFLCFFQADMSQDPLEICNFMNVNEIGTKLALYWIAWAFYLEKNSNFKAADKVYLNGIRQLAQPKDLLSRRYRQFQRRMTRQFLGGEEGDGVDIGGNGFDFFEEKDLSTAPKGLKPKSTLPSASMFTKPSKAKADESVASSLPNSLGFSIFVEDAEPLAVSKPAFGWNNLATEQERRKENESKFTKQKFSLSVL